MPAHRILALSIIILAMALPAFAQVPTFKADGAGGFTFDNGAVQGRLGADAHAVGITSLIDKESGTQLASRPGIISHYRIFSGSTRFGDAARSFPKTARLTADGAVEVTFDTSPHPFTMKAVYQWVAADTIDMQTTVTPKRDLPDFEVFLGSYFSRQSRGFVYVQPNQFEGGKAKLMPVDVNAMIDGAYMMFPRDPQAARLIYDGRWDQQPHPVRWAMPRWSAGPLAVRRHEKLPLVVAVMAPPAQCFAVACPYNKTPPDGPSGHASLYHCLFGGNLKTGQAVSVHTRMIVGRKLSDEQIIQRYSDYVKARAKP